MTNAHEITNVVLNHWVPGTRFYGADDGKFFVIEADLTDYESMLGPHNYIRRPTVIQYCTEAAVVLTDLTPDHIFDPGTTHEQALALAGYQLTGG